MAERDIPPPSAQRAFLYLGSIILVVASLYWAQKVLIPLALAILLGGPSIQTALGGALGNVGTGVNKQVTTALP